MITYVLLCAVERTEHVSSMVLLTAGLQPTVVVRKPQGRVTGQKAMMESTCHGRVTRCNNKSGCSALWCEVV